MLRKITLLVPITLLASGCAQQLAYTYESDPPYAHLACWQNDGTFKVMGQTPHTLYYTLDDHHFANRSIKIVPCRAVWASGSYATYPNVISLPENNDVAKAMGVGVSVSCTARHPDDENYEKDLQIAQLEEQRRNAVWGDILITLANGLVGAAQQNANHTQAETPFKFLKSSRWTRSVRRQSTYIAFRESMTICIQFNKSDNPELPPRCRDYAVGAFRTYSLAHFTPRSL